ncbi:MAG: hypothetical protein LBE38_06290 [Deltaproteobacteria bacterium]|nr:hypothetical protein [Deltaproteobacteria bacterium]
MYVRSEKSDTPIVPMKRRTRAPWNCGGRSRKEAYSGEHMSNIACYRLRAGYNMSQLTAYVREVTLGQAILGRLRKFRVASDPTAK